MLMHFVLGIFDWRPHLCDCSNRYGYNALFCQFFPCFGSSDSFWGIVELFGALSTFSGFCRYGSFRTLMWFRPHFSSGG